MKKLTRIGIIAVGISLLAATTWAGAEQFQGFNVVKVLVNGQPLQSDVPAVNFFGRTVLPVRAVADAAGMDVGWDAATSTVTLTSKTAPATPSTTSSSLDIENAKLRNDLAQAKRDLGTAQQDLASVRTELDTTKVQLQQAQADLAKAKAAMGSTVVTTGTVVKPSDLPVTVTSDNGMVLTVNKITLTGTSLTLNITLKNNGAATGDSMFSSTTVQAGDTKLKFVQQDQVFYDGFLSFYPGMKATGNVVFSGVPANVQTVTWRFTLEAGTDWDKKELTFQIR